MVPRRPLRSELQTYVGCVSGTVVPRLRSELQTYVGRVSVDALAVRLATTLSVSASFLRPRLSIAVAVPAADRLRVLRRQHRMPLQWPRRLRPMRLRHARFIGDRVHAVLLRGPTHALPQRGLVKLDHRGRVG